MGFSCGIVGLPNVGKSTIFNALSKAQNAESANYPFCTIDPNRGVIPVPDERMNIFAVFSFSHFFCFLTSQSENISGLLFPIVSGHGTK